MQIAHSYVLICSKLFTSVEMVYYTKPFNCATICNSICWSNTTVFGEIRNNAYYKWTHLTPNICITLYRSFQDQPITQVHEIHKTQTHHSYKHGVLFKQAKQKKTQKHEKVRGWQYWPPEWGGGPQRSTTPCPSLTDTELRLWVLKFSKSERESERMSNRDKDKFPSYSHTIFLFKDAKMHVN